MKRSVLVALSGGVDSSVAVYLLLQQGFSIFTVTLKTFCYADISEGPKSCCGLEGVATARAVAAKFGVPHFVFDVSERFKKEVIENFIEEYAAGRTPNPCVRCNSTVKIPDLLIKAREIGCEFVATGHYARTLVSQNNLGLFRSVDVEKDQTYFLWEVPREILPFLLLPVGEKTKRQIRSIATDIGLPNANKTESQEICFVPPEGYASFLKKFIPADHPGFQPGIIRDTSGKILGHHMGYLNYTIGQRKGLGGGHGRRLFVVRIDPKSREIIVGDNSETYSDSLTVDKLNLLASIDKFKERSLFLQIRHRSPPIQIESIVQGNNKWFIKLKNKARAITPGQSAVFFSANQCLGGGRIIAPHF